MNEITGRGGRSLEKWHHDEVIKPLADVIDWYCSEDSPRIDEDHTSELMAKLIVMIHFWLPTGGQELVDEVKRITLEYANKEKDSVDR